MELEGHVRDVTERRLHAKKNSRIGVDDVAMSKDGVRNVYFDLTCGAASVYELAEMRLLCEGFHQPRCPRPWSREADQVERAVVQHPAIVRTDDPLFCEREITAPVGGSHNLEILQALETPQSPLYYRLIPLPDELRSPSEDDEAFHQQCKIRPTEHSATEQHDIAIGDADVLIQSSFHFSSPIAADKTQLVVVPAMRRKSERVGMHQFDDGSVELKGNTGQPGWHIDGLR